MVKTASLWASVMPLQDLGNKTSGIWEKAVGPPCPQPPTRLRVASAEDSCSLPRHRGSGTGGKEAGAEERRVPKHLEPLEKIATCPEGQLKFRVSKQGLGSVT